MNLQEIRKSIISETFNQPDLEKAKYFKREGSPGNYKYYYTKEEYESTKGKGDKNFSEYSNNELSAYVKNTGDEQAKRELSKRSQKLKELTRTDSANKEITGQHKIVYKGDFATIKVEYDEISENYSYSGKTKSGASISGNNISEEKIKSMIEGGLQHKTNKTKDSLSKSEALTMLGVVNFSKLEEVLEKGKKANIGEVREWLGKKYQKQSSGDWKEISSTAKDAKKKTEHLDFHTPKTPPTKEELSNRAKEEVERRKALKEKQERPKLEIRELKYQLSDLREKELYAESDYDDAVQQLSDLEEQLEELHTDMEEEAGQKGDKWSDKDANRYGSEMNKLELQIEKQKKVVAKTEKAYEKAQDAFNNLESRIWKMEDKASKTLKKSEAMEILGLPI
jgi:hypothetical protein